MSFTNQISTEKSNKGSYMKISDLMMRGALCPTDYNLVLVDQDGNAYEVGDLFVSPNSSVKEVWLTFEDPAMSLDDDDEVEFPG